MMSKKHYQAIAEILGANGIGPWEVITQDFIRMCMSDNENHDPRRFRAAVAEHYAG